MVNNQEALKLTSTEKKDTASEVENPTTTQVSAKSKRIKKNNKSWKTYQVRNQGTDRMNRHFQCLTCSKTFSKLSNVKDHVRTHLGTKPYACELCD